MFADGDDKRDRDEGRKPLEDDCRAFIVIDVDTGR